MKRSALRLAVLALLGAAAEPLAAADGEGRTYELRPGSRIIDSCLFCDRAPIETPISGRFMLAHQQSSEGVDAYALSQIDFADDTGAHRTIGSGGLRRSVNDPPQQEMELAGEIDGVPVGFSGRGEAVPDCWPAIKMNLRETFPADPGHAFSLELIAASAADYVLYELEPGLEGSYLIHDCLPCGRPTVPIPITGKFLFGKVEESPGFTVSYRIEGIDFQNAGGEEAWKVTGDGCWRVGGEIGVFQHMNLEATINGTTLVLESGPSQLEGEFPALAISVKGMDPAAPETFEYTLRIVAHPVKGDGSFRRGDANADGDVDLADAVAILFNLFGGLSSDCPAAGDSNGDGEQNVADPIHLLEYLFHAGPPPAAPGPEVCGPAPPGKLQCLDYGACGV